MIKKEKMAVITSSKKDFLLINAINSNGEYRFAIILVH